METGQKKKYYQAEYFKYAYPIFLFLLATGYIFFFTQGIPFFWDDHAFNEHYLSYKTGHWIAEMLPSFQGFHIEDAREIYGIFVSVLFSLFGYEFFYYRFAKALIFGLLFVFVFLFCLRILKNSHLSFFLCLFPLFSFPLFIHTFVFDEPFIIMELFKIAAFTFFLPWYIAYKQKQTKLWNISLLLFLFLAFLSIHSYITGYSILAIIPAFLILDHWKTFSQSKLLLAVLILALLIAVPLGYTVLSHSAPHGISVHPPLRAFLPAWGETAFSLVPTFDALYYKPFSTIISFFGIWLLFLSLALFLLHTFRNTKYVFLFHEPSLQEEHDSNTQTFVFFLFTWILCELPLWITLPEHAIRYTSTIMIPISILLGFFVFSTYSLLAQNWKRYFLVFILFCLFFACITNVLYTTAFRTGWGSSFIAIDAAAQYLGNHAPQNSIAIYYVPSAGDEYVLLTNKPGNYSTRKDPFFLKTANPDDFSTEALLNQSEKYASVFVLQRITPQGNLLPDAVLENREDLEHVMTFSGRGSTFFDSITAIFFALLEREPLSTQVVLYEVRIL